MNNNTAFEQFTMFNFIPVTNNILYWNNALSYSDLLPNFIEWIDSYENSYNKISKWENNKKSINIDLLKDTTGSDLLDKRILYVVNSFIMAFEICFERYCQQLNINQKDYYLDIKNMIIDKNKKIVLNDDSVAFYVEKYQTPESPWLVSELRGSQVYKLFKFIL